MGLFASQIYQIAAEDEQARARRMDTAWEAYYGRAPDPLEVAPGQSDDNVKINKARVIVDKGVSFLFGEDITFTLDEHAPKDAQVYLDACWAANKKMTFLHGLALNGGVGGHVFVKIAPARPGESFPRLIGLDPATLKVSWQPDDVSDVVSYVIQYNALDPLTQNPRNYRQTIKRAGAGWVSIDEQSTPDSPTWVEVGRVDWPHPYPPVADAQNLPAPNEFWGISDIEEDVLKLNRAASFTLSNAQRIIRFHAHPKTVSTGTDGADINVDVDGVIQLQNPDAKLWNLEMQSDLQATHNQAEMIQEAIHEVSRVPAISTGTLDKIGPLSGVALEILYQPLVEKTKTKRLLYGDLLMELCRRLLDLAGYGDDLVPSITWGKLLPVDPLQERQADLLEDQMGVISKQTIAERLGLDWKTEKKRMDEEDADAFAKQQQMAPAGPNPLDPMGVHTLPVGPKIQGKADVGAGSLATSS